MLHGDKGKGNENQADGKYSDLNAGLTINRTCGYTGFMDYHFYFVLTMAKKIDPEQLSVWQKKASLK